MQTFVVVRRKRCHLLGDTSGLSVETSGEEMRGRPLGRHCVGHVVQREGNGMCSVFDGARSIEAPCGRPICTAVGRVADDLILNWSYWWRWHAKARSQYEVACLR